MSAPLITPELIRLDADLGAAAPEVIAALAGPTTGRAGPTTATGWRPTRRSGRAAPAPACPAGWPSPIAAPRPSAPRLRPPPGCAGRWISAARTARTTWSSASPPPEGGGKEHLRILSTLARALVRADFTDALRTAPDEAAVLSLVEGALDKGGRKRTAPAAGVADPAPGNAAPAEGGAGPVRLLAVTACPTGIARTYMAADALAQAADAREDVVLQVDTQGSGSVTPLAREALDGAAAVILATDVGVRDRERFAGLPVVESPVKRAINEPDRMLDEAVAATREPGAPRAAGHAADPGKPTAGTPPPERDPGGPVGCSRR